VDVKIVDLSRRGSIMAVKKILFCTDFSENSEAARKHAVEYAEAFGAELLIVHVIDSWAGFPTYGDWVGDEIERFLTRVEQSAKDRLDTVARQCSPSVKEVKTFCRLGLPAEQIVNLAQEVSADLIVTGTHGRTGVKHLLLGSVARNVLRMAHRPVLVVESTTSGA
jgi:nucleotide-binding universal stress UspA family protein